jgi:large subunit ribosomal protein L10
MHKMPSKQLQEIRKMLRGKAKIRMIKKSILKFAMEKVNKEGIGKLESNMPTQPAIATTDMGAFKFYALTDGMRFKTFAKDGDIAIEDVWVSAGPTDLMAGPVISELQQAGVPASIDSGKIKIRKDVCVVKKGEEIPAAKANILRKLKIEPMEVTLNVVAIYDNGEVYTKDALELTRTFPAMLVTGFQNAMNLSVFISFPTKDNIKNLIGKAARSANAIRDVVGDLGAKEEKRAAVGPAEEKADVQPAVEATPAEKEDSTDIEDTKTEEKKDEENKKEEIGGAS